MGDVSDRIGRPTDNGQVGPFSLFLYLNHRYDLYYHLSAATLKFAFAPDIAVLFIICFRLEL